MGYYINPKDMSKEEFLIRKGHILDGAPTVHEADGRTAVCLVNNGPFTAAAIVFSPNELKEFTNPQDRRPKLWYMVKNSDLAKYCSLSSETKS